MPRTGEITLLPLTKDTHDLLLPYVPTNYVMVPAGASSYHVPQGFKYFAVSVTCCFQASSFIFYEIEGYLLGQATKRREGYICCRECTCCVL